MALVIPPEISDKLTRKNDEKKFSLHNIIVFGVFGILFVIMIYFTFIRYKLIGRAIEAKEPGIAFGLASPEIASSVSALLSI